MKTNKILLLAVTALALSACSNDELDPQEIRLSASIPEMTQLAGTRAADGLMAAFGGENIFLYITDHGTPTSVVHSASYPVTGTTVTGFSGVYYPTSGNTVDIKGYYPYQPTGYTDVAVTNTSTTFSVQTDQSSDNAYKASDLMCASVTDAARGSAAHALAFNHQLTKVLVNIQSDGTITETATITLKSVKTAATFTAGTLASLAATGNAGTITVGTTAALSTTAQTLAAIMVPQSIAAASDFIEVSLASGATYTYKIPAGDAKAFAANTVYTYNVTVGLNAIQVTASINPWGASETIATENDIKI